MIICKSTRSLSLFKSILCVFPLLLLSCPVSARTFYPVTLSLSPYVGVDFQSRSMGFKSGFGDNLFVKNYPQVNFYVGTMLTDFLGIELGYETTTHKTRNSTLGPGSVSLGVPIPAGITSAGFKSSSKIMGPHLDLVGLWCIHPEYPVEVFGTLGASYLTAKFDRTGQSINGLPVPNVKRTFESEKTVIRATGGLQYVIKERFTVRATIGWENTSRFTLFSKEPAAFPPPTIKLKDSLFYGLGGNFSF